MSMVNMVVVGDSDPSPFIGACIREFVLNVSFLPIDLAELKIEADDYVYVSREDEERIPEGKEIGEFLVASDGGSLTIRNMSTISPYYIMPVQADGVNILVLFDIERMLDSGSTNMIKTLIEEATSGGFDLVIYVSRFSPDISIRQELFEFLDSYENVYILFRLHPITPTARRIREFLNSL